MSNIQGKAGVLEELIEIEGIGQGKGRLHPHYAILRVWAVKTDKTVELAIPYGNHPDALSALWKICAKNGVGLLTARRKHSLENMVETAVDQAVDMQLVYRVADVPGWHGGHFCTPCRSFSPAGAKKLAFAIENIARPYRWQRKGDLKSWRKFIRQVGLGNPLIKFAIMLAFVAPLLRLVDLPGIGICLIGDTSTGKSIILKLAGSVWGGDASGEEKLGFADALRITKNAHELLARQARDSLLVLDDIQNIPGKAADRAELLRGLVYDLVSAGDKMRLSSPGKSFSSRLVFIGASNERLEKLLQDGGVSVDPSFGVRCAQIPVDGPHGVFNHVPVGRNSAEFAKEIDEKTREHFGCASRKFLKALVEWRAQDEAELKNWIKGKMRKAKIAMGVDGQDGATDRIADYFALAYAAGSMAQKFDILPWERGDMLEAVAEMFAKARAFSTIKDRSTNACDHLQRHIQEHEGNFLCIRSNKGGLDKLEFDGALGVKYCPNDERVEYLFSRQRFTQIFGQGRRLEIAVKELLNAGHLIVDQGSSGSRKNQTKRRILGEKRKRLRVYCVKSDILNSRE